MAVAHAYGWDMGYNSLNDRDLALYFNEGKKSRRRKVSSSPFKRLFDIATSSIALVFLLPLLAPIALLIRLSDGGPALFVQERIGLDGRKFRCFKFRTMVVDAQARLDKLLSEDPVARREWAADQKLRNDPRITGLGAFLRKSSLDELPQLLNIIKGDMSVVGPRPIVEKETARYGSAFSYYCEVRPGLTGLWQISGRNDTTYAERVALDVKYVRHWTPLGDLKIVALTIPAILFSSGAY